MDRTPLILEDVDLSTWSNFNLDEDQATSALAQNAPLSRCWRRIRDLGLDPEGERPESHLIRGRALTHRQDTLADLWTMSARVINEAARAFSERHYITLLTDRDGVVVHALGGGEFSDVARRALLIEGASWAEGHRGTNAIGTAIAEGRPVAVHGRAHYERPNHSLACYASPIRNPQGEIIAVLDATSFSAAADPFVQHAVDTAARAMEELLRLKTYAGVGPGLLRTLSATLSRIQDPAFLVEHPGVIRQANVQALQRYPVFAGRTMLSELMALGWQDLLSELSRPTEGGLHVVDAGGETLRVRAEPIFNDRDQIISALVMLAPPQRNRLGLKRPEPKVDPFEPIFSADAQVSLAIDTARRVAPSNLPVMLLAESGTGKELFAQAIHKASRRANGPFIALNCGALSPQLLESELFGYGPGAFTGADRRGRDGQLQAADGGTLFLDEVAEMPQTMQAMLLRVLETGRFHRVGETQEQQVDVRLICATCAELPEMVADRRFRSDLYYRLKGITLSLPTLRARQDVVPLAQHLLVIICRQEGIEDIPTLSPAFQRWLTQFDWPGNVRELRTTLHCALIMSAGARILDMHHLPPGMEINPPALTHVSPLPALIPPSASGNNLQQVEGDAVRAALMSAEGNVSRAARHLGVARSTLYRMMKRHGLS